MPVPETLFTPLTFFFQETTTARSWIFKQLALQHRGLQTSFEAQSEEMKKKEEEHKRALGEEKSQTTQVQREVDRVVKVKDQLKKEHDTLQKRNT